LYSYRYWSDNHGTENTLDNNVAISHSLVLVDDVTQLTLVQKNIKSEDIFKVVDTVVWDILLSASATY
jgi:hypothetical protein